MIKNFFLVDDDPDDTGMFAEVLHSIDPSLKFGFTHNGWELINKLKTGEMADPHIIFLDINMPEINGWECLKQLDKINKLHSIPVIMYSASQHDAERAVKAGALCHYQKPASFQLLKEFLELISATSRRNLRRVIKEIQQTG
ncbi:MAG TPA: response regulator, partial [Ohtaekwangia sp.]